MDATISLMPLDWVSKSMKTPLNVSGCPADELDADGYTIHSVPSIIKTAVYPDGSCTPHVR